MRIDREHLEGALRLANEGSIVLGGTFTTTIITTIIITIIITNTTTTYYLAR